MLRRGKASVEFEPTILQTRQKTCQIKSFQKYLNRIENILLNLINLMEIFTDGSKTKPWTVYAFCAFYDNQYQKSLINDNSAYQV